MTQPRSPRCTVGLLTWNAGPDAVACMASLLAQTEPVELRWLDNASTDGTPQRLLEAFPQIDPPRLGPHNVGFCAGHNCLIAECRTPYYLALNPDVVLAPDYVERLCDWLDAEPDLALASGLILAAPAGPLRNEPLTPGVAPYDRLYSAGLVFPRARFTFQLGKGGRVHADYLRRRRVPGVDGSAMLLRLSACRRVSPSGGEIFPEDFFAYGEEVDLALRLARAGLACGVEGTTWAVHVGQGSGGLRQSRIRALFFRNHWLLTLRHERGAALWRQLPWLVRGELQFWAPYYLKSPRAFLWALAGLLPRIGESRRFYREFERRHGPSGARLDQLQALARAELRASRQRF